MQKRIFLFLLWLSPALIDAASSPEAQKAYQMELYLSSWTEGPYSCSVAIQEDKQSVAVCSPLGSHLVAALKQGEFYDIQEKLPYIYLFARVGGRVVVFLAELEELCKEQESIRYWRVAGLSGRKIEDLLDEEVYLG